MRQTRDLNRQQSKEQNELFTFLGFLWCLSEGFRPLVPMLLMAMGD
jgi:hypothetical protein